ALAGAPETPEYADLRARLALVKGVLQFGLNDAFKARLWQEHRALKDLNLALHEAQSRWIRVERDRRNVPTNTGEFAARVTSLKQRIDALQTRLAGAEHKQGEFLARVAAHQLEEQKDRLATYQVQARFALATMYDGAAVGLVAERERQLLAVHHRRPLAAQGHGAPRHRRERQRFEGDGELPPLPRAAEHRSQAPCGGAAPSRRSQPRCRGDGAAREG